MDRRGRAYHGWPLTPRLVAHRFANRGEADATLLFVGERRPEDLVRYPDDAAFDAWHRENRPARHWDPPGDAG